ncbi:MAG: ROK family protein, partial [Gammaproteobacteria bacterium]|nr:ROK family protein [Gammaproteobacteria bacterium]
VSSIKAGWVDTQSGQLLQSLGSCPTPQPATPAVVIEAIADLLGPHAAKSPAVGVGFPAVIQQGRARTATNIDASWLGFDGASALAQRLGRPVSFVNDADAAGIAEVRFGAGRGLNGHIMVLTFGSGIGSAPFIDGRLLPNTELGKLPLRGRTAEEYASARARTIEGLDFASWAVRVNEVLELLHRLLWPDHFVVGGAVSEHFEQFGPLLRAPAPVRAALFRGQAGIVGAAVAAAEAQTRGACDAGASQ